MPIKLDISRLQNRFSVNKLLLGKISLLWSRSYMTSNRCLKFMVSNELHWEAAFRTHPTFNDSVHLILNCNIFKDAMYKMLMYHPICIIFYLFVLWQIIMKLYLNSQLSYLIFSINIVVVEIVGHAKRSLFSVNPSETPRIKRIVENKRMASRFSLIHPLTCVSVM